MNTFPTKTTHQQETLSTEPTLRARTASHVRAHPVATYVVLTIAISWLVLFPLTLNGLPPEPGLLVVVYVGQLSLFTTITAVTGGRAAVRELFSRTFRWRVNPGWYLLAGFGLPVAIAAGALVVRGPSALEAVASNPDVVTTYLLGFLIVPLINLWEETGWMGFVQARLEPRFGPLRAALVTALFFALMHVPLFVDGTLKGFLLALVLVPVFAVPFRIVMGWLYHRAGQSVLIVAIAHASYNSSNDTPLTLALWPHAWPTAVAAGVLIVAAALVLVLTKGRVGGTRVGTR